MNAKRVVLLLSPLLFAATIAQAGNEVGVVKPANINVIALPAVQKPIVDVPPPTIAPIITVQPKILSPVQPGKLEPKLDVDPLPTAKNLPPMDSIAIDRKQLTTDRVGQQPPPINDRVGAIKPGADSGPMLSPLDDPRKPVARKKGGDNATLRDMDKAKDDLNNKKDSLNELGADKSMKIQLYQERTSQSQKILSNIMKQSSETESGITSNLK